MAFMDEVFVRILQILLVPSTNNEVIWLLLPLLFGLIMINMYFGKYKTEQLGWNTAFSNSMSLMWVTAMLFKYMHETYGFMLAMVTPGLQGQVVLVWFIAALTLFLGVANYTHSLPKWFAWFLSSAVPNTIFAALAILVVMGKIPVDLITAVAGFIIWLCVDLMFRVYRHSISTTKSIEKRVKEQQKKLNIKKGALKRSVKAKIKKVVPEGKAVKKIVKKLNPLK